MMTAAFTSMSALAIFLAVALPLAGAARAQDINDAAQAVGTTGAAPAEETDTFHERLSAVPWPPSLSERCTATGFSALEPETELLGHCRPQSLVDDTWQGRELEHIR